MMRVYICPDCGWMRMVSRRKNVECYKCGVQDMTLPHMYPGLKKNVRNILRHGCTYITKEK